MNRRSFLKSIGGTFAAMLGLAGLPAAALHRSTVVVENRKLKARWTMQAAEDMRAMHNLQAERELTSMLADDINREIDAEIIQSLKRRAA